MSIEEKEKEIKELVKVLVDLSREDVMMTYGYALALKAKSECAAKRVS